VKRFVGHDALGYDLLVPWRPIRVRKEPVNRILIASLSPVRGGAEAYAATIASAAARAGWSVSMAAPDTEQMRPLLEQIRADGVTHVRVPAPARRRLDRVRAILGFTAAVIRTRPRVIQLVLPWPRSAFGHLLACALLAVPTVVVFQLVPDDRESLRREIEPRLWLYRWARGRRQSWIAVSDHARDMVAYVFDVPAESIGRIYNGVEVEQDGSRPSDPDARHALGLDADAFVMLSIGRLHVHKGHADLLSALAVLAPRYPELRLLLAGDGAEHGRLEELAESLGIGDRVQLLGHIEDPRRLHRVADLFVFPSRYEGTPFAMLEAMAGGIPVVATKFGGAEEIIEHASEGLLVGVGDTAGLAAAIEAALDDCAMMTSMAARARLKVRQFSRTSMVDETLAVLDQAGSKR
jgi:glycosyltransferase involved in cell wall biosynthesis